MGMNGYTQQEKSSRYIFQPTPPHGDEHAVVDAWLIFDKFQPTPLQWGELPFAVACVGNPKFQPTSP